jgi:DNA modification methylase
LGIPKLTPRQPLPNPAQDKKGCSNPSRQTIFLSRHPRHLYCGDNLEQLAKLPDACVDLIYIDPPFNSSRNYEGGPSGTDFWGETKEKRAFEDRQENTKACRDCCSGSLSPCRQTMFWASCGG